MASGHVKVPHQQAEHMAAPTSTASTSNKSLANREPSTHGYSRRSGPVSVTTALTQQADLPTLFSVRQLAAAAEVIRSLGFFTRPPYARKPR